jgi:flagellar transcriptional activator FlhD
MVVTDRDNRHLRRPAAEYKAWWNTMDTADQSKEISELNLTYMLLAQKLLKRDRAAAMLRLGISEELADLLRELSPGQMVKLAASNLLLFGFRLDELPLVQELMQDSKHISLQQARISIVLASARRSPSGPFRSLT